MAPAVGVVQTVVLVAGPLWLAARLRRAWALPWGLFGFGALAFAASQAVHLPLLWAVPAPSAPWALAAWLGLLAALSEEPARVLMYRWWLPRAHSFREGVLAGLGHGGIEAVAIGPLVGLGLLQAVSVPAEAPAALREAARPILDAPPGLRLASVAERAMAMTFHVAASLLVLEGVRRGRLGFVGLAVGLHAALNAATGWVAITYGALAAELTLAGITVGPVLVIARAARRLAEPGRPGAPGGPSPGEAPDPDVAVACRGLGRDFAGRVVVDALDLEVRRGQCFALLGPNGAGKTTTVRMLCGLIAPSAGSAVVAGYRVGRDDEGLHARIGVLTEVPGLYERLTARENLEFFGRLHGLDRTRLRRRTSELLQAFGLWERRDEPVATFSKGMKQKVAIVRALLHEPEVLFLDEPTVGLDPEAAFDLRQRIQELKREGRTIFLTTHRLEDAEALADHVGIFRTRLLVCETVEALRRRGAERAVAVRLAAVPAELPGRLAALDGVDGVTVDGDELVVRLQDPERDTPRLVRLLVEAGADVLAVTPAEASLERAYLSLVRGSGEGRA
jgi:ABC-2 type transport system ATP-binding protein